MKRSLTTLVTAALLFAGLAPGAQPVTAQETRSEDAKNILLVHGAFADGSSWAKVIAPLQRKGYHVVAVQIPLTSLADDVATVNRAIALESGYVVLVGHSYGGVVITEAGNNPKVTGLVYVAAYALDEGQSILSASKSGPSAPLNSELRPDQAGFLKVTDKGINEDFGQDLPETERRVLEATQHPTAAKAFGDAVTRAAWKTKPSWYIVALSDRAIAPQAEEAMAAHIGASTTKLDSSHVVMLSHPEAVVGVIESATHGKPHSQQ